MELRFGFEILVSFVFCRFANFIKRASISVLRLRLNAQCRTMAALFHDEKARAPILRLAADNERLADQAAMLELQDADRDAGIIADDTAAPAVVR
jgi:hypothetical protein